MSEHALMTEIRAAMAERSDVLVWRNNTGRFWTIPRTATCSHCDGNLLSGQAIKGAYQTVCGLGLGSPDLIAVQRVEVAGHAFGRFVGIEVKTPTGRVSPDQTRWIDAVRSYGACVGTARSVGEALTRLGPLSSAIGRTA